jgi:hypothetical protein
MKYIIKDMHGMPIGKSFMRLSDAQHFCSLVGRNDWIIEQQYRQSTARQKAAVEFCEEILNIEFIGNIESYEDCSRLLSEFLDEAKRTYQELRCEYEAYIESLDD